MISISTPSNGLGFTVHGPELLVGDRPTQIDLSTQLLSRLTPRANARVTVDIVSRIMSTEHGSVTAPFARVVILSILLIFFALPHTLEDFATGEPAEAGVPAQVLSLFVALVFGVQALGLYWVGQQKRRGLTAHIVVGVFWPLAAGFAQVPSILDGDTYRDGFISVFYVAGIIAVGLALAASSFLARRATAGATHVQ